MSSVNSRQRTRTAFVREKTPIPRTEFVAHTFFRFDRFLPLFLHVYCYPFFRAVSRPRARPETRALFALSYTMHSPSRPEFPSTLRVVFVTHALFLHSLPLSLYFSTFPNFPFRCDSAAAHTPATRNSSLSHSHYILLFVIPRTARATTYHGASEVTSQICDRKEVHSHK